MNVLIGLLILACIYIVASLIKIYLDHVNYNKVVKSHNDLQKNYNKLLKIVNGNMEDIEVIEEEVIEEEVIEEQ